MGCATAGIDCATAGMGYLRGVGRTAVCMMQD
jgi:hypothetical protein